MISRTRFGTQDSAVITDAGCYTGRLVLANEVALDQLKLIHWTRRCAGTAMQCPGRR